ncbi:hypothetical protein [Bradyrhizobium sp. WSM471]|uniref:hypothetical protein n=1 Tax=Bradyrhizobium sp. WSM471 TaxID=319017 RepID=UPI00024D2AA8|nr:MULTISPECIES: hypothetical protein [Bradyrhizobium]EHR03033.1 hypothetical protein Bra471DRAFT_03799 [Bradyrhizobium sp. WSM471]UFW38276.1 hypothetical protein BcanWSM471_18650 [Bradyrhizobium canariense]
MKKPTGRRPSGTVIRMTPKRRDDGATRSGAVLIDRVYDRRLGRFEDEEDDSQIEGNFYLDGEEADPPGGDRPDAITAVVGAVFEAATTPDLRRRLRHSQAICAILHVPTTAWVMPVSLYFRSTFGERWLQQTRHGPNPGERGFSTSSASVSLALSGGQSVVGIAADLGLLPRSMIGAADMTIRLAVPNGAVLKTAIGRFAKRKVANVDDFIAADLDLPDLVAAFRPGAGPARILQRLTAAAAALRVLDDLNQEATPCSS